MKWSMNSTSVHSNPRNRLIFLQDYYTPPSREVEKSRSLSRIPFDTRVCELIFFDVEIDFIAQCFGHFNHSILKIHASSFLENTRISWESSEAQKMRSFRLVPVIFIFWGSLFIFRKSGIGGRNEWQLRTDWLTDWVEIKAMADRAGYIRPTCRQRGNNAKMGLPQPYSL